jgi:hypothetical protein
MGPMGLKIPLHKKILGSHSRFKLKDKEFSHPLTLLEISVLNFIYATMLSLQACEFHLRGVGLIWN